MSQTIEPFPEPGRDRRILLALLLALALHAALLLLPLSLDRELPDRRQPIQLTLPPPPEVAATPTETPVPATEPQLPDEPEQEPAVDTRTPIDPPPIAKPEESIQAGGKPAVPGHKAAAPIDPAATPATGAKSRSTVFDPGLAKKLARERNKVPGFKSEDARYRTVTGTFVQRGDRCWEVVQLISGDTSSESSQWLRRKCPGTSRSKSDIDRLARKYGIP